MTAGSAKEAERKSLSFVGNTAHVCGPLCLGGYRRGQLQQRLPMRRPLPELQQCGVQGELEHRGLAIFFLSFVRSGCRSNNVTVFPQP